MRKALVFGASGQMARALVPMLAGQGWQVDAVARGGRDMPEAIAPFASQVPMLDSRAAVIRAAGGYDAVFDPMVLTATEAQDLLAAQSDVGQFCLISTASVYADAEGRSLESSGETGFPRFPRMITESQRTVAAGQGYSTGKVAMEAAFAAARATILRPGAIHGIGARHPREWWFVKRILDGRREVPLLDGGRNIFHTSSAAGIASLAVFCLNSGHLGTFNVADPQALSAAQIASAICDAMGRRLMLVPISDLPDHLSHIGFTPWSVENPMRLSTAKARALGWDGGPDYESQLSGYCTWLGQRAATWATDFPTFQAYGHDPFDYIGEDIALRHAARLP
jgi:nucleoside-diphosphate-sugar epimerase